MASKRLFLRWALANVAFTAALALGATLYHGHVHAIAKVSVVIVLAVFYAASAYCGKLAWQADHSGHQIAHINLAIEISPMLAMLGTVGGFIIAFSSAHGEADAAAAQSDFQQRIFGASTGLLSTFVGIACTVALMGIRHLLVHASSES